MTRAPLLALALIASPALAEPVSLLPVGQDDGIVDTYRLPPAWDGPGYAPARPDMSRDRWLMCGAFAFDAATTIWSVERGNHEAAPLTKLVIGKRPSPLAVAGFMAAKCGVFLVAGSAIERTDTRTARLFYRINIGVSTVAGVSNVGVALKVGF